MTYGENDVEYFEFFRLRLFFEICVIQAIEFNYNFNPHGSNQTAHRIYVTETTLIPLKHAIHRSSVIHSRYIFQLQESNAETHRKTATTKIPTAG